MKDEKPLILIVDDESDSLTFLFDLLHNEGFRVMPVSNAEDALEAVTRRRPRLVITDLRMPCMDGLELLGRIKALAPETRVLLLTAFGDWSSLHEVLARGGDGMIQKPCKNCEILNAVTRALDSQVA